MKIANQFRGKGQPFPPVPVALLLCCADGVVSVHPSFGPKVKKSKVCSSVLLLGSEGKENEGGRFAWPHPCEEEYTRIEGRPAGEEH